MKKGRMKLLTVFIPTFNRANYLSETLNRLKDAIQSGHIAYDGLESIDVIVGDNCSTDDTRGVLERFSLGAFSWYSNSRNLGITGNILRGLELVNSKYLWMLGDDDVFSDQLVRRIVEFLGGIKDPMPHLVLNYRQFINESEIAFDDFASFAERKLAVYSTHKELATLDLALGFISANVYNVELLRAVLGRWDADKDLSENSYYNKLLAYSIIALHGQDRFYFLEGIHLYQRVTNGSHFSVGINIRVRVFVYDNIEIADRISIFSPRLARDLRRVYGRLYRYDLFNLSLGGAESRAALIDIVKKFRFADFWYQGFLVVCPLGLLPILAKVYMAAKARLRALNGLPGIRDKC